MLRVIEGNVINISNVCKQNNNIVYNNDHMYCNKWYGMVNIIGNGLGELSLNPG